MTWVSIIEVPHTLIGPFGGVPVHVRPDKPTRMTDFLERRAR